MDQLTTYSKDGQNSYCFIQVKDKLFPMIPKSTVKSWLRELKIKCRHCTEDEHRVFKAAIPTLSGAFGAMDSSDLQRLLEFANYKRTSIRRHELPSCTTIATPALATTPTGVASVILQHGELSPSSLQLPSSEIISSATSMVNPIVATGGSSEMLQVNEVVEPNLQSRNTSVNLDTECIVIDSAERSGGATEFSDKAANHCSGAGKVTSKQISSSKTKPILTNTVTCTPSKEKLALCNCDSLSEDEAEEPIDAELNASVDAGNLKTNKGGNPRIRYALGADRMPQALKEDFKSFEAFYSADINPSRNGCKLTETTMNKVKERILCFLGFVQHTHCTKTLSLSLASNLELVEEFVNYLTKSRKLMASTVARSLSAVVTAIKYVRRNVCDVERLPVVIAIRNMQRQLSREECVTRKRKREGFSSSKGEQLLFSHILDVLRQLREQYYNTTGVSCSRHLHDFTMLSLYIRALPGRCKELRTLRLIDNSQSETNFSTENVDELNALVLEPDGSVVLIESDFKTVKQMGPSKIDLTDDEWLVYFIKTYLDKHRSILLLGKPHDYIFFNKNGDAFLGSASISKYLGDLFEREINVRASTNKMRHAIVTYFMSLPDSQNIKLRESLASLLKHSVRHQQETYNDQRRQERTGMGRSFMRKTISDSDPFEEEFSEMSNMKSYSKQDLERGEDRSDDEVLFPQIGEICALLDPASTGPSDASIFVAKVLRYTPDKARVCLQEMEEVPDSTSLYRVKCASTWWENFECLSYPIDIVYNSSEKAYQLRTSPEQIYNDIAS